jgi:isoleucyl-tRNA synthetase
MWSVVEKTALAEAEVEYHEHQSTTIWVKFPVEDTLDVSLHDASVLIWTTTPWTIPANRAIAFNTGISYGLYKVTDAAEGNWAKVGDLYVIADKLAEDVMKSAKVEAFTRLRELDPAFIKTCRHPFAGMPGTDGFYDFKVPLVAADYVTDDAGTGFVHTAPGHGADDYNTFVANRAVFAAAGTDHVPHTVQPDGSYFPHVKLFEGARVFDDKGREGDANKRVIAKLVEAGALVARGRLVHSYPHSWRSKAPLIFRNTPQWFIAMDRPVPTLGNRTLREVALTAISHTRWVPAAGENRINGMIENRPDWVISRQRAWGVPITVFVHRETGEILRDEAVNTRIAAAFAAEGADAWFADLDGSRFLGDGYDPALYEKIHDVLDVWFDSGSTHAFTLEDPREFPGLAGIHRRVDGGTDTVMYLEGSDQHRGWFHSSLLESCGTRGRAPYDVVLTHGFVLDEKGEKMSKSKGNTTAPQDVIRDAGADILRLWVAASDYSDDLRIGPEILKTFVETYRKLRNTLRWMLGTLAHHRGEARPDRASAPELERLMLHRLAELDVSVREAYAEFDYKKVVAQLSGFMTSDLSAFYFDVRKDVLYCDPISSPTRHAALDVIAAIFDRLVVWLAPILVFTAEEAWQARHPGEDGSVHLAQFPETPADWRDDVLAEKWAKLRRLRRVVTGALEIERAQKRIGASLEAAPVVHVEDDDLRRLAASVDFAEVCITSGLVLTGDPAPEGAFRVEDVPGVAVVPALAEGRKCARSWKISPLVGADPAYPDVTPRDAAALREWDAAHGEV